MPRPNPKLRPQPTEPSLFPPPDHCNSYCCGYCHCVEVYEPLYHWPLGPFVFFFLAWFQHCGLGCQASMQRCRWN